MLMVAQSEPAPSSTVEPAVEKAASLISRAIEGDGQAIAQIFADYGLPLVWAVIIIIVSLFVGKILSGGLRRSLSRAKLDQTLARFFAKMLFYVILVFGVVLALSKFGIDVTAFAAVLAAAGFAVGMALSGTLANFAAGAMLLLFRPFKVNDVISTAGVMARVDEIELFTTTLDTFDNRRIIVPNGSIYGSTIENITYHPERRVDVNVGIEYRADLDKTREVLSSAAQSLHERMVQGEGRGYQIALGDLGSSSVNWTVHFWCRTQDYWMVKEELTRAVKQHLDAAGIGIPFPQMDVHVDGKLG